MAVAVAEKTKPQESTPAEAQPERKVTAIDPTQLKLREHVSKAVDIRLPEGVELVDINEAPETLWKWVQGNPNIALQRLDDVRLFNFEETWMIRAVVSFANKYIVRLADIRKVDLPSRDTNLYSDENYQIKWCGTGYATVRKRDNQRMSAPVLDYSLAMLDCKNLYSR